MRASVLVGSATVVALFAGGCRREDAAASASVATPVLVAAQPAATSAAQKVDPALTDALKAGLAAMVPRIVEVSDGYQKVEPRQDSRFAMHPDKDKSPVIEFDVSGLKSLRLSPYIADFSGVKDCDGSPDAGVVDLQWKLDNEAAPHTLRIDRHYHDVLDLDLAGAARLKVEVTQGNGVPWCDWFGLGVFDVKS